MEYDKLDPNLFLDLPWLVVREILSYVPKEYISETFLKVPGLRYRLIEEYYSELHFVLTPLKRPHACFDDKAELIDIASYGEISSFLDDNPDIVPQTVRVMTSMDFISMRSLLTEYRDWFLEIPNLHFHIESHHFTDDCFEFIQSFPNLRKLQLTGPVIDDITDLSTTFWKLRDLETLVLLGHGIKSWSGIKLPPNLKHLDISWTHKCDITTINIPSTVEEIYWNDAGVSSEKLRNVKFPSSLSTLVITECKLESLTLSDLPQSLKCLAISRAQLTKFVYDDQYNQWPHSLETLILSYNQLDNNSLRQLSQTKMPSALKILKLDGNRFTHLHHLKHLPDDLKFMDISKCPIQSLEDPTNDDGYSFYHFPQSLETLNVSECLHLTSQNPDTLILPSERIRLPESLLELDLSGCWNIRFDSFFFPRSLRRLSLSGSNIADLNRYDYTKINGLPSTEPPISWRDLEHLISLDLSANSIRSLTGWNPPPKLVTLDLMSNMIKEISATFTIFNRKKNQYLVHLQNINLANNKIENIDDEATLPSNLVSLSLENNLLARFKFTDGILNSPMLRKLNLAANDISQMSVATSKRSTLEELDLSLGSGERTSRPISSETLYGVFEKLGLQVARKKRKVRTLHQFIQH